MFYNGITYVLKCDMNVDLDTSCNLRNAENNLFLKLFLEIEKK